ncbi:hypothetical protein V1477_000105 [Vespula maculifrons]|uniref:Uncharacterized protein n=1 Tax=Vespula maculifrons TaxID=7453 RepID=A0ABD2D2L5_VESMC
MKHQNYHELTLTSKYKTTSTNLLHHLTSKFNNKKIYSLDGLLNTKITIEKIKDARHAHTQKYCTKTPRCMKYTTECAKKIKDENVKCVNCSEKHPANYKSCMAYIIA